MASNMGTKDNVDDEKPVEDGKMGANIKNTMPTKNNKSRRNDSRLCLMGASPAVLLNVMLPQ